MFGLKPGAGALGLAMAVLVLNTTSVAAETARLAWDELIGV
jgi:hypothetical protein